MPSPGERAEAGLRSCPGQGTLVVQVRASWYIYVIKLTSGSEPSCLGLNGPCVSYSNLGRTAVASSELRNPHLNWAFFKVVF